MRHQLMRSLLCRRRLHEGSSSAFARYLRIERAFDICLTFFVPVLTANAATLVWIGPETGGLFNDGTNWSAGVAPGTDPSDSAFFNGDSNVNGTISFSADVNSQDLFLQGTGATITLDVGANEYVMSRFMLLGTSSFESDNNVTVTGGELETGHSIRVGNSALADRNNLLITGQDTVWRVGTQVQDVGGLFVGVEGNNSQVTIADGATVLANIQQSSTWIGAGSSNNLLTVTGSGSLLRTSRPVLIGASNPGPTYFNNRVDVLAGGRMEINQFHLGVQLSAQRNTLRVSGPGSKVTLSGACAGTCGLSWVESFATIGAYSTIGWSNSDNTLLIEDGGEVDGTGSIRLGYEDSTSTGNLLHLNNGKLTTVSLDVRSGTLRLQGGSSLEINRYRDDFGNFQGGDLRIEQGSIGGADFQSGVIATASAEINNGSSFRVGNGSLAPATYRMKVDENGSRATHRFVNGLFLNSNGTLTGNGNIFGSVTGSTGAQVDVGSAIGQISVTGNWNNSGIEINLEIANLAASTVPGVGFDRLNISGTAASGVFTHGGSIVIDVSHMVVSSPREIKMIGWRTSAGSFGNTIVSFIGGSPLQYNFLSDGLYVMAKAGVAGDFNSNGKVDAADYTVYRNSIGLMSLNNRGAGITGPVGPADYAFWKSHFGEGMGSGATAGAAIPEPISLCQVLGLVAIGLVWRGKHHC